MVAGRLEAIAGEVCLVLLVTASTAVGLDLAVPCVHADYLWAQGYLGSGVEIGVVDLFVADMNHPSIDGNYLGYVNFARGAAFMSDHATAVTGAAVGQDATYTGVAPLAGWWTGQTTNRGTISSLDKQTLAVETFGRGLEELNGDPVEVITLSIGMAGDTSALDQWSLAIDHVAESDGRVITVAAGNSGPGSGTLVGYPAGAYNAIIVGATGATGGGPPEDYSRIASFSSRGPTTDGRCKPDIVAPGSIIRLPVTGGAGADGSGTSFATPLVAGGAALLVEMGRGLGHSTAPKVIKSVLLNSADKLEGWSNTPMRPLDHNQGAGQMNLRRAYRQYLYQEQDPGGVAGIGWDQQQCNSGVENRYLLDVDLPAGAVVSLTLCWDRIVTTDTEDLKKVTYSFDHLANLDLYLYREDGPANPVAASISTVDNVEHIYYLVNDSGRYVIGVDLDGGSPDGLESYGLAWSVRPSEGLDFPGDADLSGTVDVGDLGILGANYGQDNKTWFEGDFNDDGEVDIGDLGILGGNYGNLAGGLPGSVPEPASALLLSFAGGVALLLRRGLRKE